MTADSHDPEAELLLDFLATAPEPLRDWADRQAAEVRHRTGPPAGAGPAPSDLALAELGELDDEGVRRPRIHTPMDKDFTPVAPGSRRGRPLAWLLAAALVAAVGYGVFRLGQPAESAAPAPVAPAATTTGRQADAARMAELEAELAAKPDDVAANLELGVLRFNSGDVAGAEALWLRVTELDPRNPQAWFNLGFVALAEDPPDVTSVRAAWDQVLAVAPDSDLAATVRSHLDALAAAGAPTPSPAPSGGKG